MKKGTGKGFVVWMMLVCFIAVIPACGGGETSGGSTAQASPSVTDDPTENETADSGPAVTDNYYDSMAKYTDSSKYDGTYALVTDVEYQEDCSAIFGNVVAAETVLSNTNATTMDGTFLGDAMHFSQVATEYLPIEGDYWSYGIEFSIDVDNFICFALLASGLEKGESLDMIGYGCVDLTTAEDCMAMYERPALRDFSDGSVKSVTGGVKDVKADVLSAMEEQILDIVDQM